VAELTIDELARETGMTVRNVRSHQTRGLLPGPDLRGRVGYYGDEHVERLRLIQQLQDDGLPLRLVERLLLNRPETAERLLALRRAITSPAQKPEPVVVTVEELVARFGEFDNESLERAFELGAIVPRVDGTFVAPLPGLLDTADAVMQQGIPLKTALRVAQQVRRHCEEAAQTFVDMILQEVWAPFDKSGRPDEEWPQIAASIQQIRPLASEIFLELLPPAIDAEIEREFGDILKEQASAE
jgi:DNA-binding transcriptional MerR regulator